MNRREFTKALTMTALMPATGWVARPAADEPAQVAITIDDFNWSNAVKLGPAERNRALLDALRGADVKAALFVASKFADNETGGQLLKAWDADGHMIANHSYSHLHYHSAKVTFDEFAADLLRGEAPIKGLPQFRKFFRFPYLKEGNTVEKRDKMRAFLKEHGYRNGHVTIDASDWYVDQRLRQRLAANPAADLTPYRDYYLDHVWERASYYDSLARKVLGRGVKHTLLLHHNLLNGLFLGDVLRMFGRKGWRVINAAEAFTDPVFSAAPATLPAGESVVWALAKESGKFDHLLRYPAEDGEYEKAKMDKLGL